MLRVVIKEIGGRADRADGHCRRCLLHWPHAQSLLPSVWPQWRGQGQGRTLQTVLASNYPSFPKHRLRTQTEDSSRATVSVSSAVTTCHFWDDKRGHRIVWRHRLY